MEVEGESRRPYLYYNTWNFQERNKWWNGKGFTSFSQERMLQEIDIAHRMGLEIFVMVTGWHGKTGDWEVNRQRFPDDLKTIKARLDEHGMKLGLRFNPTMAAVSSKILAAYRSCIFSWKGKLAEPGNVWGSEVSYPMCLVSEYADAYADTVIRVARETGARYFVWMRLRSTVVIRRITGRNFRQQRRRALIPMLSTPLQLVRIVVKVKLAYPEVTSTLILRKRDAPWA